MEDNLLLQIRVEALRANLEKIRNYLETVPDRSYALQSISDRLAGIRQQSSDVKRRIVYCKLDVEENKLPELDALKLAEEMSSRVVNGVAEIESELTRLKKGSLRFQENRIPARIRECLQDRSDPCLDHLKQIETAIQRKQRAGALWQKFRKDAAQPSQSIFTEYIDLLGGIALRDTGFDAGISQLADELIQTYKPNRRADDPLLTIPARDKAVSVTLTRIIRLSFPEWTIWALPFTAHEFWHVVVQNDLDSSLRLAIASVTGTEPPPRIEPHFQDCLADGFATYTMGPAYAYSTFILLLDPWAPFAGTVDRAAHDLRAAGILSMLKHMESKGSAIDRPPYADVHEQLGNAWETALRQTGAGDVGALRQQLAEDRRQVEVLVQALWNTLEGMACSPMTIEAWDQLKPWPKYLLKGNVDELDLPVGAELRQVLNAAWLARIDPARDPRANLTQIADKLAMRTIARKAVAAAGPKNPLRGIS